MTATNLARFKKIFEDQLEAIARRLSPEARELSISSDEMIDEVDFGAAKVEQAMSLRLKERESKFMEKISAALKRITDGTFGACQACGEEIALRRLEARPMSSCCVQCQEKRDRVPRCRTPLSDVLAYQRMWAERDDELVESCALA